MKTAEPNAPQIEMSDHRPRGMRLPSLTGLKAFDVVGRTGSLRRAAQELGVSHSSVARQMRDLEHWFGVKLLATTAQGTCMTLDGQRLHRYVSAGFDLIFQGAQELKPHSGRRMLRIWCPPGIAVRWITPRLPELQKRLPDVDVVLAPTYEPANFHKNEADLELRFGWREEPGLVAERLGTPAIIIVASPAWISAHPQARDPRALMEMKLLHEYSTDVWRLWFEKLGLKPPVKLKGPCLGILPATVAAACLGHGPALVAEPVARDLIEQGKLEVVVDVDVVFEDYVAICREERAAERAIVAFKRWFRESLAA
jgi:DNA-binding transcriptional LysR family regulator